MYSGTRIRDKFGISLRNRIRTSFIPKLFNERKSLTRVMTGTSLINLSWSGKQKTMKIRSLMTAAENEVWNMLPNCCSQRKGQAL
ncbi:hypothetical protein OWV82_010446 [Melia azedarach]|uniref:Uncharacterized protein n=1 Tax=Melia azedarach TaxID=155640 RepID=A0ACC1Y514_MELAZ|nr:hypothetical protein OWV82_010446 [Melia azedarach]